MSAKKPIKKMQPAKRTVSKEFMKIAREYGTIPIERRSQIIKKIREMAKEGRELSSEQKAELREERRSIDPVSASFPIKVMPRVIKIIQKDVSAATQMDEMLLNRIKNTKEYFERYRYQKRGENKSQIRKREDKKRKEKRFEDFLKLAIKRQKKTLINKFAGTN
ncbi:MAG: hypothetical protein N3D73_01200 [Candidatus Diapherotrites archaeon]|nr:hypothetical protein [Candidatus Diapherotrites archaeon]